VSPDSEAFGTPHGRTVPVGPKGELVVVHLQVFGANTLSARFGSAWVLGRR
jgi:hypothetical protein